MKVFIGVLESYENLLQDFISDDATPGEGRTIPQPCALQLLFNFKFFSSVLAHPSIEEVSRMVKIIHIVWMGASGLKYQHSVDMET